MDRYPLTVSLSQLTGSAMVMGYMLDSCSVTQTSEFQTTQDSGIYCEGSKLGHGWC
jgi:hypothetical protein